MDLQTISSPITVDILLATYNGEKYLSQQIESLQSQTHLHWRLLISDDGSNDSTIEIIKTYSKLDLRIVLVNEMSQGGIVLNFQKALESASAKYLMFCDQDDIWLSDKIEIMLAKLLLIEADRGDSFPILGFSDMKLIDSRLVTISENFYYSKKLNPNNNLDPRYLLWSCTVYGCSTIFNAALLRLALPIPLGVPMHDQWFALLAATYGTVFHLPRQTINYRQHDANVVGARHKSFLERAYAFPSTLAVINRDIKKCIAQLTALRKIKTARMIQGEHYDVMREFSLTSFGDRWAFLLRNVMPFMRERFIYGFVFSIMFLFRLFK